MSREHPLAARASASAARLRHWLIYGPAQIRVGAEAGAIAGTLTEAGHADYAYGEITGYYLHWLSSPHLRQFSSSARLASNAAAALAWCTRRLHDPLAAPTRIALRPMAADWRNEAAFCFDLAMLVGGISAASRCGLVSDAQPLLHSLLNALVQFADADGLRPARTAELGITLPDRWSTRKGPFLVKAAARILSAEALLAVPPELSRACHSHVQRILRTTLIASAEPMHPTLYFLEGALALAPEHNRASAVVLQALLAQIGSDGSLPESLSTPDVRRADIVAQALRVGVLLRACGDRRAPKDALLDGLAEHLLQRVRDDGAIAFREDSDPPQLNVWCAMFTEQALAWYSTWRGTRRLSANAWDIV